MTDLSMMEMNMKKCSKCHKIKPFNEFNKCSRSKLGIKSDCKECHRESGRKYAIIARKKNKDILNERTKKWRVKKLKENPNFYKEQYYKSHCKSLQRAREYYYRNREKCLTECKLWRKNNHDLMIKTMRQWKKNNRERYLESHRLWMKNNSEHVKLYNMKRRANKRKVTIQDFSLQKFNDRMSIFGFKCVYCGGPFEHIDHAIPLSKGGKHCLANLRPSCKHCNLSKHDKSWKDWMKSRGNK